MGPRFRGSTRKIIPFCVGCCRSHKERGEALMRRQATYTGPPYAHPTFRQSLGEPLARPRCLQTSRFRPISYSRHSAPKDSIGAFKPAPPGLCTFLGLGFVKRSLSIFKLEAIVDRNEAPKGHLLGSDPGKGALKFCPPFAVTT